MSEYKDLYNRDQDFKEYVDKFAKSKNLTIDQVFKLDIIKEYANYLKSK